MDEDTGGNLVWVIAYDVAYKQAKVAALKTSTSKSDCTTVNIRSCNGNTHTYLYKPSQ